MDARGLTLKELTAQMHELVQSKGWYAADSKRPQTPRNLAVSLSVGCHVTQARSVVHLSEG